MTEQRMSRWMGPLGLVILVCFFVGFGVLSGNNAPGENASGASVIAYFNTHAHQVTAWASIYVVGLGLALLLLFVSQLRSVLSGATKDRSPLPNLAFAAGLVFVAGSTFNGTVLIVRTIAVHNGQATIAQTMNFIDQNDYLPMFFGMGLLALATGLAILNRSTLPRWLGRASVVIGVVTLTFFPFDWFAFLAAGIWLPVLGFVIGAKAKKDGLMIASDTRTSGSLVTS
jgi:hypothetical protein